MNTVLENTVFDSRENDGYEDLLAVIHKSFEKNIQCGTAPLFRTNAGGLYDLFLKNIPAEARQHYNCNACRHFVNRYGSLVTVNEKGGLVPVMWSGKVPDFFKKSVSSIKRKVSGASITGVFVPGELCLGTPVTGSWKHIAVNVPKNMICPNELYSRSQMEASLNEDRRILAEAIRKYREDAVDAAVTILRSNTLYRGEKVLGVAEWFQGVIKAVKGSKNRNNLIWRYTATAPTGFCHISSSMIGTLLDDIESGLDLDSVRRRFAEKMDLTQYQRPQAKPSVGNVARAEKIVDKLEIVKSLDRRFARLDELKTMWTPSPVTKAVTGGVFIGIGTKEGKKFKNTITLPDETMTWEKFQRTVLPSAKKIEYKVTAAKESYSAIVTADDFSAPPIIQWDTEQNRNPFTWYLYANGSFPDQWCLSTGFNEVTAVVMQPNLWQPGFERHGKAVFFILKGCRDTCHSGLSLFPECLKSELREVRSTIEAYSNQHYLRGYERASACGIRLQASSRAWNYTFRVTTDGSVRTYKLDRWD